MGPIAMEDLQPNKLSASVSLFVANLLGNCQFKDAAV